MSCMRGDAVADLHVFTLVPGLQSWPGNGIFAVAYVCIKNAWDLVEMVGEEEDCPATRVKRKKRKIPGIT